ncbi:MAG TPA: STAS domain-containing protein [Acidimicrobiales bacterium]|jgi:anti-sigma B factor antagonist|nr:STAS domain-containing protein [Acidimicrobiales bacterium]
MITRDLDRDRSFELGPRGAEVPLLDIRVQRSMGTVDIDLIGDLDVSTVPELWETLAAVVMVGADPVHTVAINVSRLNYSDSTGLGCLVMAHKRCMASGVKLHLSQPDVTLQRLFEVTGLDQLLDID